MNNKIFVGVIGLLAIMTVPLEMIATEAQSQPYIPHTNYKSALEHINQAQVSITEWRY